MDPRQLRKFAAECLQLALTADAGQAAELRRMAQEMLDMAGGDDRPAQQQQQQIQTDKENGN